MLGKKKYSRVIFWALTVLLISVFSLYLFNKNQTDKLAKSEDVSKSDNFFQKPGVEPTKDAPVVVEQTKTVAELEQTTQSKESVPADYNLLATTYYQKGDKDQALKAISDGLAKFPNDDSLLKTKDLIENILPNL